MEGLGRLIMTGIGGTRLEAEERRFIESCSIGGVLLFSKNFESPAQLAALTSSLRSLGKEPPFIAVDQEGGRVVRFRSPFSVFPPMGAVAKVGRSDLFRTIGEITAKELSECGVNVNFSPVCDIPPDADDAPIGDRAFGIDKESVSKNTAAFIQGSLSGGVLPCAKHFPGHGATQKDSHIELPVIDRSLDALRGGEFVPFYGAIKEGVPFVMTAHLSVDSIDRDLPTSLSPQTYAILRRELGFTGLAVTDDMQMGAITEGFGTAEAAVLAISSGADIIEYRDAHSAEEAYLGLCKAVRSGALRPEDIGEKCARISRLKRSLPPARPEPAGAVGSEAHRRFVSELAARLS